MLTIYETGYKENMSEYGMDVHERVQSRRKRIAEIRQKETAYRRKRGLQSLISGKAHTLIVIVTVCFITGLIGYIGAYNNVSAVSGLAYTAQAADDVIYKSVVVHSGDTLWGIAGAYTEPKKDIRNQIKEICELNGIEKGVIYPGQVIVVPVPAYMA